MSRLSLSPRSPLVYLREWTAMKENVELLVCGPVNQLAIPVTGDKGI